MQPEFTDSSISQPPALGDRCTDVLKDTLEGYAGIEGMRLDLNQGSLRINYDPRIISDERALLLVQQAGTQAWERINSCAAKGNLACAECAAQIKLGLPQYMQKLTDIPMHAVTTYDQGVMEVKIVEEGVIKETSAVERNFTAPAPRLAPRPHVKVTKEQLEVGLTALTAAAALTAFLGQQFGFLSPMWVGSLYVTAYLAGGYFGLIAAVTELLTDHRLNVDLLMILAAIGAAVIGQPAEGAALLFLFSLSNTLQSYAMDRSRKAIEKLLDLRPPTATVRRGSRLITLTVEQLVIGDVVIVRPGERFPIDGTVINGTSTADQASITGESMPVPKSPKDTVFAGTVNGNGSLEVRTTRLAQDTTLAKIVQMVEEAQSSKARTQNMLDNFEQVYAVIVLIGAGVLIAVPPLLFGQELYPAFYRAMTWLVVASPCALVISTPASILSAIASGARRGVLFKGGVHLERMSTLKVIAFDKTGTLTYGKPKLASVYTYNQCSQAKLLQLAASAESRSEHPLAAAVLAEAEKQQVELLDTHEFQAITGQGVEATVNDRRVLIGNSRMFQERRMPVPHELRQKALELEHTGHTVMFVYHEPEWCGLLAVADTLRPDAAEIVTGLKNLGIEHIVMLTGDNERVAASIAAGAGVNEVHAGLLPQDKVRILKQLQERYGPVAMVGDGVNDAPALASADLGIAMGGAGTDVALETADVVLMADDLSNLPYAIALSREARRIVWQNITFSLAVIVLLVATAFGAYLPLPLGVVGHEGSTVIVVLNGLRLLRF